MLGPLIGYGTDYALFQFVYDLHMWTMLGSKKNVGQDKVPLRIMLKGASFSPHFWRLRHLALIDAQRQLGFPTLFFTMSPYEWSFPYHAWIVDELDKDLRTRLHLPAAETFHLSHCLVELVEGWLTGQNSHSTSQKSKNWCCHIIRGPNGERIVIFFVARLEFQDGKHKIPKHGYNPDGDSARSFGRGAVHIHVLMWLEDGEKFL